MIGKSVTEWVECLGGLCVDERVVTGCTCDSRVVQRGFVFFALRGNRVDGHDFLLQARDRGAILAVVDRPCEVPGLVCVQVENVIEALQKAAQRRYEQGNFLRIAVTGSVGKTTTKEFLSSVLSQKFYVAKTPGNANSQVGLPLSILQMEGDPEIFVMEMGMTQAGHIRSLVEKFPPDIAIVTAVALAHAENFPLGLEQIAEAKAEVFSHPRTKTKIAHHSVKKFAAFASEPSLLYYGEGTDFFLYQEKNAYWLQLQGQSIGPLRLPFTASHFLDNFIAAACVGYMLGLEKEHICESATMLSSCPRRFEKQEKEGVVYINDSYNANPCSMKAALANLPSASPRKKVIAVLGTMAELGDFTESAHREVGAFAAGYVDLLLCLGQECASMCEEFSKKGKRAELFSSLPALQKQLQKEIEVGDVVLIKASRSVQLWQVLEESK